MFFSKKIVGKIVTILYSKVSDEVVEVNSDLGIFYIFRNSVIQVDETILNISNKIVKPIKIIKKTHLKATKHIDWSCCLTLENKNNIYSRLEDNRFFEIDNRVAKTLKTI